jgi:hypothetical protein
VIPRLNTMFFTAPRLLLTLLLAAAPLSVFAALGGNADSVAPDKTQLRAQLRTSPGNGYSVHNLQTAAGIHVREYVSAQSKVFAVAWEGPNLPDLTQLLGDYFPAFRTAMAERRNRGIRGPVLLQQDDLVVESNGHMRAYFGRAYVPSLVPPQVSIEEIR